MPSMNKDERAGNLLIELYRQNSEPDEPPHCKIRLEPLGPEDHIKKWVQPLHDWIDSKSYLDPEFARIKYKTAEVSNKLHEVDLEWAMDYGKPEEREQEEERLVKFMEKVRKKLRFDKVRKLNDEENIVLEDAIQHEEEFILVAHAPSQVPKTDKVPPQDDNAPDDGEIWIHDPDTHLRVTPPGGRGIATPENLFGETFEDE